MSKSNTTKSSNIKKLLKTFKTDYCKLILIFVKNVKAEVNVTFGKSYYGKVLKARLNVDDIKELFKVWDKNAEMIVNRDIAFFDQEGVLFDFYSVAPYFLSMPDEAKRNVWLQIHKLYMSGKGILDITIPDDKANNDKLLDWSKMDIANMVSSDMTPLIDNVREMDAASRKQGKNLARELYGNVIKYVNNYIAITIPKYCEKIIIKMFKSVINTTIEFKTPSYATDVIPKIMSVMTEFSDKIEKDKRFTKEIEELLKNVSENLNVIGDDSKSGISPNLLPIIKALLNSNSNSNSEGKIDIEGAGSLISNLLCGDNGIDIGDDLKELFNDEEALEEKASGLLSLIKEGIKNGNIEEVIIEWLHDNTVILNLLRTQFPSVEFLKQGRKPKSKNERLKELLKHRRDRMVSKRKGLR